MTSLGIDLFLLLTPLLLLATVALLGFVGCDIVWQINPVQNAVGNLQAVPGNSQVMLTWDAYEDYDGNDATDYHVVRSSGGGPVTDEDTGSTALTFFDTGLANGTTYTYHVYALSPTGQSGNSNSVDAMPNTAISFVQMQAASQATNPPISVTLNNTGVGNLLIAAVSFGGLTGASVKVSDNLGNAFTVSGTGPWFRQSELFFLPNIPGGNVMISATAVGGASGPCSICVSEYTGADLTAATVYGFSTKASPGTGTAGIEPIQGLILNLAQAGDVAYVVVFATQATSLSAGSGFTVRPSPTTSLLVEDSLTSIAATDTVATLNGGAGFVPWVALAVGIKA